jgi:hypothetical protein
VTPFTDGKKPPFPGSKKTFQIRKKYSFCSLARHADLALGLLLYGSYWNYSVLRRTQALADFTKERVNDSVFM